MGNSYQFLLLLTEGVLLTQGHVCRAGDHKERTVARLVPPLNA